MWYNKRIFLALNFISILIKYSNIQPIKYRIWYTDLKNRIKSRNDLFD